MLIRCWNNLFFRLTANATGTNFFSFCTANCITFQRPIRPAVYSCRWKHFLMKHFSTATASADNTSAMNTVWLIRLLIWNMPKRRYFAHYLIHYLTFVVFASSNDLTIRFTGWLHSFFRSPVDISL